MHVLDSLIEWYRQQCDGEWEHQYGVKIDTLDNPGWSLTIDVTGTDLQGHVAPPTSMERTDTDWCHVVCDGYTFRGAGGVGNLTELLSRFIEWAENELSQEPD